MKILLYFKYFEDISSILYLLSNFNLVQYDNHFILKNDFFEFIFYTDNDEFLPYGVSEFNPTNQYDLRIHCSNKIIDTNKYDFQILNIVDEPLNFSDNFTKILDKNIILSSTYSTNLNHPNFISDYKFDLYYFYHSKGFSFLNFYENKNKNNLVGIYQSEANAFSNRRIRVDRYNSYKSILNDDLFDYTNKNFNLKPLLTHLPNNNLLSLNGWKNNYISSYTDMIDSVAFLVDESWTSIMDGRMRITEKTLKSILFSKSKCFSIWNGTLEMYKILIEDGFWFLNSEFYDDNLNDSILKSLKFLKNLKTTYKSNENVYEILVGKFGHKLESNYSLLMNSLKYNENTSYFLNQIRLRNE